MYKTPPPVLIFLFSSLKSLIYLSISFSFAGFLTAFFFPFPVRSPFFCSLPLFFYFPLVFIIVHTHCQNCTEFIPVKVIYFYELGLLLQTIFNDKRREEESGRIIFLGTKTLSVILTRCNLDCNLNRRISLSTSSCTLSCK